MGLRQLKVTLRDDIVSARHVNAFDQAREREPALAVHAGILSVLAVMADETDSRYGERDALTRVFIREHQRGCGSFWSSVLLFAYAPMLMRLRSRICGDAFGRHDLDQMVIAAFLEEVRRFPLDQRPNRLAMFLRQGTQRSVLTCSVVRSARPALVAFCRERSVGGVEEHERWISSSGPAWATRSSTAHCRGSQRRLNGSQRRSRRGRSRSSM